MAQYNNKELPKDLPLIDFPIGTIDDNQVLVEKAEGGYLQLWKNDKGKFGVQRIKGNKFVPIVEVRADEDIAREVFSTMAYSAMAYKVVQWLTKGRE